MALYCKIKTLEVEIDRGNPSSPPEKNQKTVFEQSVG